MALDGAGRVNFHAPAGRMIQFAARYPATVAATDTIRLMFDHDKSTVAGFTVTPPSALNAAYLNGSSTNRDSAIPDHPPQRARNRDRRHHDLPRSHSGRIVKSAQPR